MRLRNKKTGKVYTLSDNLFIEYTQGGRIELRVIIPGGNMSYYYDSLAELNEDWEDYKPAEPIIKDKKVRKAVRAWAKVNKIERLGIQKIETEARGLEDSWFAITGQDSNNCLWTIEIHASYSETVRKNYKGGAVSITELCGEEEE